MIIKIIVIITLNIWAAQSEQTATFTRVRRDYKRSLAITFEPSYKFISEFPKHPGTTLKCTDLLYDCLPYSKMKGPLVIIIPPSTMKNGYRFWIGGTAGNMCQAYSRSYFAIQRYRWNGEDGRQYNRFGLAHELGHQLCMSDDTCLMDTNILYLVSRGLRPGFSRKSFNEFTKRWLKKHQETTNG